MIGRFSDKVMVVTGAAQGIGQCVAQRAAEEGARLFLIDRSPIVFDIADALSTETMPCTAIIADLEQWSSTQQAIEQVVHAA